MCCPYRKNTDIEEKEQVKTGAIHLFWMLLPYELLSGLPWKRIYKQAINDRFQFGINLIHADK